SVARVGPMTLYMGPPRGAGSSIAGPSRVERVALRQCPFGSTAEARWSFYYSADQVDRRDQRADTGDADAEPVRAQARRDTPTDGAADEARRGHDRDEEPVDLA